MGLNLFSYIARDNTFMPSVNLIESMSSISKVVVNLKRKTNEFKSRLKTHQKHEENRIEISIYKK